MHYNLLAHVTVCCTCIFILTTHTHTCMCVVCCVFVCVCGVWVCVGEDEDGRSLVMRMVTNLTIYQLTNLVKNYFNYLHNKKKKKNIVESQITLNKPFLDL